MNDLRGHVGGDGDERKGGECHEVMKEEGMWEVDVECMRARQEVDDVLCQQRPCQ